MLTNNFYKILLSHMNATGLTASCKLYSGSTAEVLEPDYILCALRYMRSSAFSSGKYGTYLGTGTTPPTMDDYKLESPITDGTLTSSSNAQPQIGFEKDHARIYATHEVKNSGENDVTITEIGVFGTTTTSSTHFFMIDRTVLETPITIPAGESRSITVAIRFDYPTV